MKETTRTIRQSVSFSVPPSAVFEALMDSKKHAQFTGGSATISRKAGGSFSVYDGYAIGKNMELIKDRKIVQSWHAADWPDGIESVVTFLINPTKTGCRLSFTQTGVPSDHLSAIKQGWIDFYWGPLKEMFKNPSKS